MAKLLRNWFSLAGLVIVGTTIIIFGFLFAIESLAAEPHAYFGIVMIFMPPVMLLGLGLVGWGYWMEQRLESGRSSVGTTLSGYLDLGDPNTQRRMLLVTAGASTVFVFAMAVLGFTAYEYTDSVEFCGETCHVVMHPQNIAYKVSPHARVACADCHTGHGAGWYVRSKLSGMYQVYAYALDRFPRPIPTPIESLRPAQDTCEECHWPTMFFGGRQRSFRHYLTDGSEEPWEIDMLLKVGGGGQGRRGAEGIHWHIDPEHKVEYFATDLARQEITWVRVTEPDGSMTEFRNPDAEEPDEDEIRRMDCLDCHNRPAHRYGSPVELLNAELERGHLEPVMPEIKLVGLEALAASYETNDEALASIAEYVRSFYDEEYPEWEQDNPGSVDAAIGILQDVYEENMFPEMKTRWSEYPDNSSHWMYAGCFRCHMGHLVSDEGREITSDCSSCHIITGQGFRSSEWESSAEGLVFVHPGDFEVMEEAIECTECHDGSLGF